MTEAASYAHGACAAPLTNTTIGATLDRVASRHGRGDAVVARPARLTYGALRAAVDEVARGLMAVGVEPGARVGIWGANCVEWIVTEYAVAKIGAVLVHLNPSCRSSELQHALDDAGVSVLVVAAASATSEYAGVLAAVDAPDVRTRISAADASVPGSMTWDELRSAGAAISLDALRARAASVEGDDAASIIYTSGTTGRPKGVALSHRSLVNNAFFIGERLRYGASDRVCLPVPLHHTFGHMLGSLAALTHGSAIVLPGAMFDPKACLDCIEDERCSAFYGVPSMFAAVLQHPRFSPARVASLRTGIMAGAPCPIDLMRAVVSAMHMPEVTICYGLTEGGTVCQSRPSDPIERRVSTVGAVHPHVECKVVDPATRRTVRRGVTGELWVRSYAAMIGYWRDEAATREIVRPGGWIRTGDLASMRDEGYVNIVGRLKEMVISAGRNIYPREIEDALRAHAKVRDVAVVGVPDSVYGEAACAWIEPREGERLTADEILRFCRERVAPYNVPRRVKFTDRLPMTASGKVQKFRLREQAIKELGLAALEGVHTA